jgi:thiamine biosynthesis lipoprotein
MKSTLRNWAFVCLAMLTSCVSPSSRLARFEFSRVEMGVPFRIVSYAEGKSSAEAAANDAFARIEYLNSILSDYDPDSELSRLSQTSGSGQAIPVSAELWFVLSRSREFSVRSGGAFDVTVGPAVNLWRYARRVKKFPDTARLARARQAIGYEKMRLDPKRRTVELLVPNMRLDLGAIAKGYAADEGLKVLRNHGITRAFVSAAGDMAIGDAPPGKGGWKIELPELDPQKTNSAGFIVVHNCGLATSGDLFQFVEIDGKRYSHIVDPRTGVGLTDHSLVTVIAPDGTSADAWSTTLSVMGPDLGLKAVRHEPLAVRIMRQPNGKLELFETTRFVHLRSKAQ